MSEMSYDHERTTTAKTRRSTQDGGPAKQVHPSVGMLLHMQRTAGNTAVNALLNGRATRNTAVQREAAEEEEPVQAMGSARYEAVQRHTHHIPPKKEGTNVWNTGEEED